MPDSDVVFTSVPFGPGPGLSVRSLRGTPYLSIEDANGAPILTLAVGPRGYIVHRAAHVEAGGNLGVQYDAGA